MRKVTQYPQFWYNPTAKKAYWYAYVIKARWMDAESIIMKHQHWAYEYARFVINDRWLEAEDYILSSKWAKKYRNLFLT